MIKLALHSVPRSGSTWLGSLLDSHPNVVYKYQPLFSYAFKGFLDENSNSESINNFFDQIGRSNDPFINQTEGKYTGIIPSFYKHEPKVIAYKEVRYHHILRNLLLQDGNVKVIGLVRNPLAVLHSWLKAPKEFKAGLGWKFEDEWRDAPSKNLSLKEEFNGYTKWKEVAGLFLKLRMNYPERFYLLEYADLLNDTEKEVHSLMNFIGLGMDQQQVKFIGESKSMHNSDAYSVFKTKESDQAWKELPREIIDDVFSDLANTELSPFLR